MRPAFVAGVPSGKGWGCVDVGVVNGGPVDRGGWPTAEGFDGAGNGVLAAFGDRAVDARGVVGDSVEANRFRRLMDVAPVGLFETDLAGRATYVNAAWCQFTGLTAREGLGVGWFRAIHPEDRHEVWSQWAAAVESGSPFRMRLRYLHRDGSVVRVDAQAAAVPGAEGAPVAWLGVVTDLTETDELRGALSSSEARFRAITELSTDVIYRIMIDPLVIDYVSPSVAVLLGRGAEEFYEDPSLLARVVHADDYDLMAGALDPEQRHPRLRVRFVRVDGTVVFTEAVGQPILDGEGRKIGIQGALRDITVQAELERELQRLANTDPLTGLANRRACLGQLEQMLASGGPVGVVYVDLDGFKAINDRYGHATGDAVLIEVATRLRSWIRGGDVAARLAGDEFVVVCAGGRTEVIAQRLRPLLARPVGVADGGHVTIAASIGWADRGGGDDAASLLARADAVMYAVKQARAPRLWIEATAGAASPPPPPVA